MKQARCSDRTPGVPAKSQPRDHVTRCMPGSEGLTWGGAGGGQLVLAPKAFVEVQGQWNPGGGMGKS